MPLVTVASPGEPQRITHGNDFVARVEFGYVSKGESVEVSAADPEDGQVPDGIRSQNFGAVSCSVVNLHLGIACVLDDVVVGENQSCIVVDLKNHAGPGAFVGANSDD